MKLYTLIALFCLASVHLDASGRKSLASVTQTSTVETAPQGGRDESGTWTGAFVADGRRVVVDRATQVSFAKPLTHVEQVLPGAIVRFKGRPHADSGDIIAGEVRFTPNILEPGEAKLWRSVRIAARDAAPPGELHIDRVGRFQRLASAQVQVYVSDIGWRLVPDYQRTLPADAPNKIPFQFHVVSNATPNAFATPNGIVIVNSGLFDLLTNEAQLAAVLAHEIAHVTHEHTWREQRAHRGKRLAIGIAGIGAALFGMRGVADLALMASIAFVSHHSRALENQADRVGLHYMVNAGYDPRAAVHVWTLPWGAEKQETSRSFWSSHESQVARRLHLATALHTTYRDLELGALRIDSAEYALAQSIVRASQRRATTAR